MAAPVTVRLREPVQFGKDAEPITELVLKPTARHFRDLVIRTAEDGTVEYEPYRLALVGMKMAGQSAAVLDLMDPRDMSEVAAMVMGFISPGQPTGSVASPSSLPPSTSR